MNLVVIIGGSSGIGLSLMKTLSNDCTVVNISRNSAEGLNNIKADVTNRESISKAFNELLKVYGIPDIMVYCSGFVDPQGILEITKETWGKTIETNLTGAFYCTQEYVKAAKEKGGKIVYISSTSGMRPQPGWSAYAASKAGLINFSLTMAEELKDYNMKVYCLAPGRCATPLRKILAPNEDPKTIMQPQEVAQFIEYLITNENLIDNQVIVVKKYK
ncbi:SDR family oxidoreductase [Anaerovorax odorimutans]|uniref:SDR family oxidoreductase n=1 Tax=Anaerovorax odorimutans TaxID=109327 RepID=UPI000417A597|nr:SDR family oxidoreductase [Anaerovorax odorimutans]